MGHGNPSIIRDSSEKMWPGHPLLYPTLWKNDDQMAMRNPTSSGAGTTAAMFASELEIR